MKLGQACRPCRESCSLIPGRGCFGDLPGKEIVVSPPSQTVDPLPSPPDRSTSFSVNAESPALPCRNDVFVENGAAAPKSCLSHLEMRTPTAAGSSSATMTILHQLPLWLYPTEEIQFRTSIQYDSYYSIFWRINNQQTPFWPRVIDTKEGQNLVFDPGGSIDRLRACPFLGTWRALLYGEFFVRVLDEATTFFGGWMTSSHQLTGNNSLFLRSGWSENAMP